MKFINLFYTDMKHNINELMKLHFNISSGGINYLADI